MIPNKIVLNVDTFNDRIFGMMAEYQISMSEALLWDFESFGFTTYEIYDKFGMKGVENRFRTYLLRNGLVGGNADFYADIFLGRENDRVLRRIKDAESEDQSSGTSESGTEGA
jgi:hypothetical protein